jgi:hypothetical protein
MKSKIQNPCLSGRQAKSKINPKSKCQILIQKPGYLPFIIIVLSFVIFMSGCDAFVRKFTRKPKKENLPQQEMVLTPEEYPSPQMTKEELYRQYFLFWKSWHEELIESLLQKRSQKKQIDCAQEALNNLINLRGMLNDDTQKKLDVYIAEIKNLLALIIEDTSGINTTNSAQRAENIKRNILRDFTYNKIKNYLT